MHCCNMINKCFLGGDIRTLPPPLCGGNLGPGTLNFWMEDMGMRQGIDEASIIDGSMDG